MEQIRMEIVKGFQLQNFTKSFMLTWAFLGMGILVLLLFLILAGAMPQESYLFYFLQNVGIFLLFNFVLLAFTGVYRLTGYPDGTARVTSESIRESLKKLPTLLGITFATTILLVASLFIQLGVSAVSYIPYAGPVIVILLTAPFFIINFSFLILAVCIFALSPPMVGEAQSLKNILNELRVLILKNWLNVLLYLVISLSLLFLSTMLIYFITTFAVGVTRSVQWSIGAAYPKFMMGLSMKSFLTDIATRISPRPGVEGMELFRFIDGAKYIIGLSYVAVFSCILSFPLAAYFNVSSAFFKKLWKDR